MNTPTRRASLPHDTQARMQTLLNEADAHWFLLHPGEQHRERLYFRGEQVLGGEEPARHVVVSHADDGRLMRRFLPDGGDA